MRVMTLAPVGTILTPSATFTELARGPRGRGLAPILGLGVAWSLLSGLLALGGHQPSGPVAPPFTAEGYYLRQAIFLPFLLWFLWRFLAWSTGFLARALGGSPLPDRDPSALADVLGYAFAVPVLTSLVLPDLLILWIAGFDGLAAAMLYYAPLTLFWTLILCTLGTRTIYELGWIRGLTAALGGLMALALVGGIWIR